MNHQKKEELIINSMEFQVYYNIVINYLRKQFGPKKGFRNGKIPDLFITGKYQEELKSQIAYFGLMTKYGDKYNPQVIKFEVNQYKNEKQHHTFSLTLYSDNESFLNDLIVEKKNESHEAHDHKHEGHEAHDHKHEGHEAHDHKHEGHEAHDHKHEGHEAHDHKHEVKKNAKHEKQNSKNKVKHEAKHETHDHKH